MSDIKIYQHVGTISDKATGWQKELNIVSVDGGEVQFDLREWSIGRGEENGGISFTEDEAKVLYGLLKESLKDPIVSVDMGGQIGMTIPEKKPDDTKLFEILKENKVEYIDKREKGGALWVIGGHELDSVMMLCKEAGYNFKFTKKGGKQTKGKPGWYMSRL